MEGKCSECGHLQLLCNTEYQVSGKILIIQIELFENNGESVNKINKTCGIKGLSSGTYQIQGKTFKVVNAILHHGQTMEEGHYTSFVKFGHSWIEANDSIIAKKSWPRNSKNVYLLILEQV